MVSNVIDVCVCFFLWNTSSTLVCIGRYRIYCFCFCFDRKRRPWAIAITRIVVARVYVEKSYKKQGPSNCIDEDYLSIHVYSRTCADWLINGQSKLPYHFVRDFEVMYLLLKTIHNMCWYRLIFSFEIIAATNKTIITNCYYNNSGILTCTSIRGLRIFIITNIYDDGSYSDRIYLIYYHCRTCWWPVVVCPRHIGRFTNYIKKNHLNNLTTVRNVFELKILAWLLCTKTCLNGFQV